MKLKDILHDLTESKSPAKKIIDGFIISPKKNEDGDFDYIVTHEDKTISFKDKSVSELIEILFDLKNNEEMEDFLRDISFSDNIVDKNGNGFPVSDIADHLD